MKISIIRFGAIGFLVALATGCSIAPLSHEGLAAHEATRSGTVAIAERAEGLDGSKVGWGRITPFAIPVVPIYVKGDESLDLMSNIKEALQLAGFNANTLAGAGQGGNLLVLKARVNKKRYSNYTYFMPIIPTWGGMNVTLDLVNSTGESVWQQDFDGSGFTFNFFDGYNVASRESMTEMLDQMVAAFASDGFYNAVNGFEPALTGTEGSTQN